MKDRAESIGNKKYSVIKFQMDDSYSEIPTSWLTYDDNKQKCWWPPRTANAASLIVNCTSPNFKTWKLYEVDVVKQNTSLESARKSAANSTYETTDDDKYGRGKRSHIACNQSNSEEENCAPSPKNKKKTINTNKVVSTIPLYPDNLTLSDITNNDKSVKNINDTKNCPLQPCHGKNISYINPEEIHQLSDFSDVPIIFEDDSLSDEVWQEDERQEGQEEHKDSDVTKYLKEMIRTQEKILTNQEQIRRTQANASLTLRGIQQLITRMEDVVRSRAPLSAKNSGSLIAEILPLQTVEAIQNFDTLLHDTNEAVTQFKEFLLKIGGNNPRDNIHRVLSKIFTNKCAMNCFWKGIRNNFKVSNLLFMKIMRREITLQHSTLTETDFDNIAAEWLQFGKQRKQREEKGKNMNDNEREHEREGNEN